MASPRRLGSLPTREGFAVSPPHPTAPIIVTPGRGSPKAAAQRGPLPPGAGVPCHDTHGRAQRWAQTALSSCQPLAEQPGTQAPSRHRGLGERPSDRDPCPVPLPSSTAFKSQDENPPFPPIFPHSLLY